MSTVMTFAKIALRNLKSKPVTSNYPFEPAVYPEGSRGHIELDFDSCVLCGLCSRRCPTGTIKVDRKAGTWSMNRFDCVQCQNCVNACAKKALKIVPGYYAPGTEKVVESYERPVEAAKPASAGSGVAKMDPAKCKYCTLCARNCPNEAITVDRKEKTWTIDKEKCVGCGLCASKCNFGAITIG